MKAAEEETIESLGPYSFVQKKAGHRLTQDTVLLADFLPPLSKNDTVIDLGTGAGVIPLMLAWRSPVEKITGVEADKAAVGLAMRNVEANGLGVRVRIVGSDWRELKKYFQEGSFSIVLSNPPYSRAGSGRVSPVRERAIARSEILGGLPELIEISRYLAGESGRIFYIFPVKRVFEMAKEARAQGLEIRRLRFIHTLKDKPAKLFLIELGRKGELEIEGPVFI